MMQKVGELSHPKPVFEVININLQLWISNAEVFKTEIYYLPPLKAWSRWN